MKGELGCWESQQWSCCVIPPRGSQAVVFRPRVRTMSGGATSSDSWSQPQLSWFSFLEVDAENLHLRQLLRWFLYTWMFENIGLRCQFSTLAIHVNRMFKNDVRWDPEMIRFACPNIWHFQHVAKSLSKTCLGEWFLISWAALRMYIKVTAL